jgi:hypothetical protein
MKRGGKSVLGDIYNWVFEGQWDLQDGNGRWGSMTEP